MDQKQHRRGVRFNGRFLSRARIVLAGVGALLVIWMLAQFVLAEKEAHVYVFPSSVTSEGWENDVRALGQDLSSEAELSDFSRENSAYIFFGDMPMEADVLPPAPADAGEGGGQSEPAANNDAGIDVPPIESSHDTATTSPEQIPESPTPPDILEPGTGTSNDPLVPAPPVPASPEIMPPAQESAIVPAFFPRYTSRSFFSTFRSAVSMRFAPEVAHALSTPDDAPPLNMGETSTSTEDVSASSSERSISEQVFQKDSGTAVSRDPYAFALCTALGKPCHLMEFTGFGLGGALEEKTFSSATLELSLAGREALSGNRNARVSVRIYHGGRWESLGEVPIQGELSNGKRGGYASFVLPNLTSWSDLAQLKAVIEYVDDARDGAQTDALSVYLDGLWINVTYAMSDTEGVQSPEDLALTQVNVRDRLADADRASRKERRDTLVTSEGDQVLFVHAHEDPNAKIVLKTDRETYHALGGATTYFNVTNDGPDTEEIRVQFYFANETGKVVRLSRFANNIPHQISAEKYDAIGYFCSSGWSTSTSTDAAGRYFCSDTEELQSCDALNEEQTNCVQKHARVGLTEDVEYRNGWLPVSLSVGSFRDAAGIFAMLSDLVLSKFPKDAIPFREPSVLHTTETFLLRSGQTAYFRSDIELPLNSRGDFSIEAAGESGAYGLVHAGWDGSWNHRTPLVVDTGKFRSNDHFAVPIALDDLPASFWDHVNPDGGDVRFVAADEKTELPYWLLSWNYAAHSGLAWVRLPPLPHGYEATGTPLFLYVGDKDALSRSDQFAPFRTADLVVRGTVFGGTQRDLTLYAIALDGDVRIKAGKHDEITLKKHESAIFSPMTQGEQVLADGPVGLSISAPNSAAGVIPFGYAGSHFVLPGIRGEYTVSFSGTDNANAYASLRTQEETENIDLVPGSILGTPAHLDASMIVDADKPLLARLSSGDSFSATAIYPATSEPLFGFAWGQTTVGFGSDASDMRLNCSSGGRHEIDGRREGTAMTLDRCVSGSSAIADAVRIDRVTKPLGVLSNTGGDLLGSLPKSEFASSYLLTEDARAVLLSCAPEEGPIVVGVFDPRGLLVATTSCAGVGASPGKAFLSPEQPFTIGSELRSMGTGTLPFLAAIESDRQALSENVSSLSLLTGAPLARGLSPNHPTIQIGQEEFIVPGEHRKLDIDISGKEKKHVNRFLSEKREFAADELPQFTFEYISQSNTLMRRVRDVFDVEPFTVARVMLIPPASGEIPVEYDIVHGADNQWTVTLRTDKKRIHPGRYTLSIQVEEGGELYADEYDFYWGTLAINYQQSVFTPGETVELAMAALSDNGNTLCDARLKLWISDPSGAEREIPVASSGVCDGNNVVHIPDYAATYVLPQDESAIGRYRVRLVRLDGADNVASRVEDGFDVRASVPYVVSRIGPTRIYPVAQYSMQLRVRANEDFEGNIVEKIPGDFIIIDRGNANLEWSDPSHAFLTATWSVALSAGQTIDLEYVFDAPDRSPYLYFLGPLRMESSGNEPWSEARQWQIASDAVGKMLIFWDQAFTPADWTCVSCVSGDPFYQRFIVGSSTYSGVGGAATHTHTSSATVYSTSATGVGPNTTTNTSNAPLSHSHTLTPGIGSASNLPAYRQLRILQANSAGEPATLPAGAIVAFDIASSSLPTNWNRYAPEDGRYIRGESTTGMTGGGNVHTHTATGTLSAAIGSGLRSQNPTSAAASQSHTHTLSATSTGAMSNEPPYVEVLLGQLTATSAPANYAIAMWSDTPPVDWMTLSGDSGAFSGKFLKASTTYGATAGASSHTHADILGATTSVPSANNVYNVDAANAQAPSTHTHSIDITAFSTQTHLPPYIEAIFAKRLSGITLWEQNDYRWYANQNANTPTDPWPSGGSDIGENDPVDSSNQPVKTSNVLRLRMSLLAGNATSTVGSQQFKLQYAASASCASALNWSDVEAIGTGGALWRGYDNGAVANNADIASTTLVNSNTGESYVEENSSAGTPTEIGVGQRGEWDWVLQNNLALAGTNYCFRMVRSDGTPLDTYTDYPQVTTNEAPGTPALSLPFDNEKVATTSPDFRFVAVDAEIDDLDYEIAISSTTDFAVLIQNKDSGVNPELFDNLSNPSNKAPFNSGDLIHFRATSPLVNGATYWWRMRAKDPSGSNTWGSWSSPRSFTVDTALAFSTWYQTTMSQWGTNTLVGVESTSIITNDVALISGSTTGTMWSPMIDFSLGTVGTAWGAFSWGHNITNGSIVYRVEYLDATSTWALIPDVDLADNSTGTSVSPLSLLSVSAATYPVIRLRADLADSGGTPRLLDWTLAWGSKVTIPAVTTPFDNATLATTTPSFEFYSSDPERDDLYYEFQWSTSASFTSSTTRNSEAHAANFINLQNATDTNPFNTGDNVRFTIAAADLLTNGTTYYYRVRAKDPLGANDFSFWSPIRSFTVDTATIAATWFQTATGQFDTDTLTSMYNYGFGSSTVATSTTEAMFAYGEGTEQTPKYRIWSGSSWGAQLSGLSVGATIQWLVLRASTVLGEYILGTLGSDRDVTLQVYRNNSWGNSLEITGSSPSLQRRSFDIAYETLSGRALAVACDGDADPAYSIWNGSSWGAIGSINITSSTNCEWIRLASDPTSNEIILLERDTGSQYEAQVWNGSTWGNATTLGSMSEVSHEGMAVIYEESGDQALVVTSDGNSNDFRWTAWNGLTWSTSAVVSLGDDFENGSLRRDKGTDNIALCYIDHDEDAGVVRWNGSAWSANIELTALGTTKDGRPIDCAFETTSGRDGYIMTPYSDTTGTRYQFWNGTAWSGQSNLNTIPTTVTDQVERTMGDLLLSVFFDHANGDYLFSSWSGSAWSSTQTLESSASVASAPYGEPFMIAPKNPAVRGTIVSTSILFADGNAPGWGELSWSSTTPSGAALTTQIEYFTSTSSWAIIPDSAISGNSAGLTASPVSLQTLNTTTYNQIRLVGNTTCSLGNCPVLHDWTVKWAPGIALSGTAKAHDLTTNVTSGTVGVAVNGVLQSGKTGTIAGGQWSIANVTVAPGNVVEVFVMDGAPSTRAVAVAKYLGTGDMGGFSLNERWVTVGSASTTFQNQTMTLADLALYDNSISGDSDLFFDVSAGGDYSHCAVIGGSCFDSSLYILAGNTFRPTSGTSRTVTTYDLRIAGSFFADANTIKIGGSWRNLGGFTANTSTILFNGTSSPYTIDSTGAATSTFFNITFGESGNTSTWSLVSSLAATGTLALNFGTLAPNASPLTLEGDLTIGSSGIFAKGSGTTTFAGATGKNWTDSTASKQDLGNILIDGAAKTVTLASSVRASNVTIGADDTLNAGGTNTFTVTGGWTNSGTFTPQTGTVAFATTTASITINQGTSAFYNLTFNGSGGSWRWQNTNATTSNDLTITTGAVTLPGGTLAVGGSFNNIGGTFAHNDGFLRLTSTASGKTLRSSGSKWNNMVFAGTGGGWNFADTNATTSGSLSILAGTPVFPSGALEVGNNFDNQSGAFVANGGVLRMTSTTTSRTVRLSGSSLATLFFANAGGSFTILDTNATATLDVIIAAGDITLPSGSFSIGGSFTNSGTFAHGSGTLWFNASSGSRTINPGASPFAQVMIRGTGSFTIPVNATSTGAFTLDAANAFTQNPNTTLEVGGNFTNTVGGAATTWTNATLYLNSGTNYSLNAKTTGGDSYGTLKLGVNTHIRAWNSSASVYDIPLSASLYSQDHGAVDGALTIFGNYARSSGSDYWSYATDFDGTALGGSSRQVNVRFAANASSTFSNSSTLEIMGGASATTSIDRDGGSGIYSITLASSTLNASYYQIRHMDAFGLNLTASSTVTALSFGDFSLDVAGGSSITVSSSTIAQTPGLQIFNVKFATSTGIASGANVTAEGGTTAYWRFKQHYGNYAGEVYDNDPLGNPGNIRWDDSDFSIAISGTVYADAGVTPLLAPTCNDVSLSVRVKVNGLGDYAAPCSSLDGSFTVPGVVFNGETVMTIYLDTNGGADAAVITKSAVDDLNNINLYQHRVIVRHEDVTPMTIVDMNAYDGGDDPDIPFIATDAGVDTLSVDPEHEFWIWSGKTFAPGGNITLQSGGSGANYDGTFHIDNNAVFTGAGTESHSVGGRWVADSGATFTSASTTFTFTATTSGKTIIGVAPLSFWKMIFNGTGGAWSADQNITLGSDLTVSAGTLSGASSITVNGTSISGAGVIAMTGGTFSLVNGGSFGGNSDWSFNGLTLGSGSVATTTKSGSGTTTVAGVLTVAGSHALLAGASTWNIAGGGTPFVLTGSLDAQTSLFRYSTTTAITVTPATYHQLLLAPSTTGTPTYTLAAGTFSVMNAFTIGDGTNPVTVSANTNDPTVSALGEMLIRASATFVASDIVTTSIFRGFVNQGVFTHSGGTIAFLATTTGHTIAAGASPFGTVLFNSASGGWTISGNATSTSDFTLSAANDFTLASGATLEVDGIFTNGVSGAATTWSGGTLYLNSGTGYSLNTKTVGADTYATLALGANTAVRMWNSSAATTTVSASGSLYSQDHGAVDGALTIFGNYARSSGTDYWSYTTDWDGTALGGSSRQANVRFATSASATFSSLGALEVVGASTASTTLDTTSAGQYYGLSISGGSTTMSYFSIRSMNTNGLNISGAAAVHELSDGDFELAVDGGSMITVAGAAIDANPLKTFFRDRFATGTAVTSGSNVKVTGSSASAWRFNLHYGVRAGEVYDSDPGGDPGYVIWDDSAAQLVISGNVYSDEGTTPIGGPTCDGVTQNVRLKIEGVGSYTSACDASTGAYSISGVIFNPGDTLIAYLNTDGGARAVNVAYDPATNINNMHLYQNRVIVRHEQGSPVSIARMNTYDADQDTDIPYMATLSSPNTLSVNAGTALIVWSGKTFAPGGNVTMHANASTNVWDGQVHLFSGATWSSAGTEVHTIGGQFWAETNAAVSAANSTFTFTATTSGKLIAASSSLSFYNLTFNSGTGSWNAGGVGTTSNDLAITSGTVALPTGTLAIGGSFDNSGGTFTHNDGTLKFTATGAGKNIRASGSSFGSLLFDGVSGGWTFLDVNATSTASTVILNGTVLLPTGTFAVGADFDNRGVFSASASSTLKMTSLLPETIRLSGSSLGGLLIAGAGSFTVADLHATTTGNVFLASGTTTFPAGSFALYGSFTNASVFDATTSTVMLVATSGVQTISPGDSSFFNVVVNGAGSSIFNNNATTTGDFLLRQSGGFTQASGTTLAVSDTFTNQVGGAQTTWTGSTLKLSSGTTYALNSKTSGGDVYGTLELGANTNISMWNSTSMSYVLAPTASLYSQDHNAVDGSLYIYGLYRRTAGSEYWSYATDWDGTALGGSSRQANVRFASGASILAATGTTLEILGSSAASTTIDRESAGSYGIELASGTFNAGYYRFRNINSEGLKLTGTTTIAAMNNGDFELAQNGGTMITIASTTIDQNASAQYFYLRFATTTAISGVNVTRIGTTTNAITFGSEYGNMASEAFDNDGADGCGSIRWTDSACLFSDQKSYRWRNDDGGEGVPASEWYDQNWSKRKRVHIVNNSPDTVTNAQVRLWITSDADMQSDFDDLRFTDASGTTSIPFWVEAYSASASSSVWAKVPTLPASSAADIYMYYGNSGAASASVGTTTFAFFDDFEDASLAEYSGDTSLFEQSTSFNYERTRGIDASAGNESTGRTTDGIGNMSASIGRNTTIRFYQYIDMSSGGADEPCFLFAMQSPVSNHQNYGVCLSPFGADQVKIVKNAANNGRNDGSTQLASQSVTYTTGWYEVSIDWLSSGNQINVNVNDSTGAPFASVSATDASYTSGGIGFSYWGQHGGWDIPSARAFIASSSPPSVSFGIEQIDSGASWKANELSALVDQLINETVRLRLTIRNTGTPLTGQQYRLQVASKASAPNCESVSSANYSDVTTSSGGCGSSPACMAASAQFANNASTTQLLSTPGNMTFAQGQIVEDPSNETGNISLESGEFTETEYSFTMTPYATEDAYCFRATNDGAALDNYTKVAELRVLQAPFLSGMSFNSDNNIVLTEGTTTTIFATSTVTDFNGFDDITAASSTFYRSSVAGGNLCAANDNECYQIATTSCSLLNCSGNSCTLSCSASMRFFADPTDVGSVFAADNWQAKLDVWDTSNTHDSATSSQELYTLRALSVPETLNYGSVTVGEDTGPVNAITTVVNTGNSVLNLLLSGLNMEAGPSLIDADKQKFATSTFTYSSCTFCTTLSTTTNPYGLNVLKPTSTSPFSRDIYWGLFVPNGTKASTYSGANTFIAN